MCCDDAMIRVTLEEFEDSVRAALDAVPAPLMAMLDNVAFFVEAEPADDQPADLLGIYEGVPLTERDLGWAGVLPDRITLFQGPLTRICADREELEDEIAITVVHEIAHHFGIDDDRLHELGWG
jgi:predicted Zn-dependent protease with MMP-like domain